MGMDGVEFVMACEERFGIEISDKEAEPIRTPAMLIELIAEKLRTTGELNPANEISGKVAWTREAVAEEIQSLLDEVLGIKRGTYSLDADFVRDLGVD